MADIIGTDEGWDEVQAQLAGKPEHGWTCFHCGETFTTPGAAKNHFGFDPSSDPACIIKLGAERGLVNEIRKQERELERMRRLLHDDASDSYQMYADQQTRHRSQLENMEELGYERGLRDGRAEPPTEDAYMAACRALHWRTAELRAHGIEPIAMPPDASHYPPDDYDFGPRQHTPALKDAWQIFKKAVLEQGHGWPQGSLKALVTINNAMGVPE